MVKDKWCLAPETCPLRLSSDPFDSHDDRDDDGEGESVEEHKSVIMHLLSQVRLGMDLTKVKTSLTSMLSHEPGSLMLDSSLVVSLCSVWIYLTAVVLSFYSLTSSVQAVSFKQPTQLQFYSFFPLLYFTGGLAYLHPRKEIFVRNVRRLLCTSWLICKVMVTSLISPSYCITQT